MVVSLGPFSKPDVVGRVGAGDSGPVAISLIGSLDLQLSGRDGDDPVEGFFRVIPFEDAEAPGSEDSEDFLEGLVDDFSSLRRGVEP